MDTYRSRRTQELLIWNAPGAGPVQVSEVRIKERKTRQRKQKEITRHTGRQQKIWIVRHSTGLGRVEEGIAPSYRGREGGREMVEVGIVKLCRFPVESTVEIVVSLGKLGPMINDKGGLIGDGCPRELDHSGLCSNWRAASGKWLLSN